MYKHSSESLQTRDRLKFLRDAIANAGQAEILTDQQRLDALRAALQNIEQRIRATALKSEERKKLGAEKRLLADECQMLKEKLSGVPKALMKSSTIERLFINEARARLDKWQFEMIYESALRALREEHDLIEKAKARG